MWKLIKGPHLNLYRACCFVGWYMAGGVQHRLLCQQSFLVFLVVDGEFVFVWFFTANNCCSNPHFSCLLSFSYLTYSRKPAMAERVWFSYSPTLTGQSVYVLRRKQQCIFLAFIFFEVEVISFPWDHTVMAHWYTS